MTRTLWAVLSCTYACLYILEIWNVKLYDYPELILIFYPTRYLQNLLNTHPSQWQRLLQSECSNEWMEELAGYVCVCIGQFKVPQQTTLRLSSRWTTTCCADGSCFHLWRNQTVLHCVSKMHQLWNGVAQNYNHQFWWNWQKYPKKTIE